jgi:hypothetical protein
MRRSAQVVSYQFMEFMIWVLLLLSASAFLCWSEPCSAELNPSGPNPKVTISQDLITFSLARGKAGPVDADASIAGDSIKVVVQSSTFGWTINYLASPLTMTGPDGPGSFGGEVIMPNRLLIKTPYTNGFESLDMPRLVSKGDTKGDLKGNTMGGTVGNTMGNTMGDTKEGLPAEVADLQFRYMATGHEAPGTYEGDIYSADMGPIIHVRLIVGQPGLPRKGTEGGRAEGAGVPGGAGGAGGAEHGKSLLAAQAGSGPGSASGAGPGCGPGSASGAGPGSGPGSEPGCGPGSEIRMSLSPEKIRFSVAGFPKECDADSSVLLSVESKEAFMVKAHATPLKGEESDIPPDRLFVNPGNGKYYSLENDVVVLERTSTSAQHPSTNVQHPSTEGTVSTTLSFKLKTGWDDAAGEYSGTIVFTCMPEM